MQNLHQELEAIDLTIADLEDKRTSLINQLDMSNSSHSRKPARIAKMDKMNRAGIANVLTFPVAISAPSGSNDIKVSNSKDVRHPW